MNYKIKRKGISTKEYFLSRQNDQNKLFQEVTRLTKDESAEYKKMYDHLVEVNENRKNYTPEIIGKSLENLVTFLLDKSAIFSVLNNLHTSTNEIDQLVQLNPTGKEFRNRGLIDIKDDFFLCECKNYLKKIDVTWVGKFYSLLRVSNGNGKLGIIFSYYPLSGKSGWTDGIGLTKKIHLKENYSIISFSRSDYEQILQGSSLISLIHAKMIALSTDTNYLHHLSEHPAQSI
ncbi:acetylglutamate semialdehyde dehydrogenase [Brevibacillus choshinensis]|uniref:acetylglutamate semialdehyde dehydrogenase n=1 Tax=Brevibacillus choshinensis TaxID=54911 RepID=UPI002E21B2C5|nr:acetylglutamate semialdehyde dehydrogenase [Brevibacillus choshinensis]